MLQMRKVESVGLNSEKLTNPVGLLFRANHKPRFTFSGHYSSLAKFLMVQGKMLFFFFFPAGCFCRILFLSHVSTVYIS